MKGFVQNVVERAIILADEGRIDVEQLPDDIRGRVETLISELLPAGA